MAAVAVLQVAVTIGLHWSLLPYHVVEYAQENAFSYVLYLIGGAVVAAHLSEVHDWLMRNALLVVSGTVVTAHLRRGRVLPDQGRRRRRRSATPATRSSPS